MELSDEPSIFVSTETQITANLVKLDPVASISNAVVVNDGREFEAGLAKGHQPPGGGGVADPLVGLRLVAAAS